MSISEEAFAHTNLPVPPRPTPLWRPGGVPGDWADVCGFITPRDSHERWQVRMHGAFSISFNTLVLRERIEAASTLCGSISVMPTLEAIPPQHTEKQGSQGTNRPLAQLIGHP